MSKDSPPASRIKAPVEPCYQTRRIDLMKLFLSDIFGKKGGGGGGEMEKVGEDGEREK